MPLLPDDSFPIIETKKTMSEISWPENKSAALSITFDDSRLSQLENGIPILDRYGFKGVFYVLPHVVEQNRDAWKAAMNAGHEMGNHTVTHPCSGNFRFSQHNALEEYSPSRMESELDDANEALQTLLGEKPRTFAYPCGQTFIGRGEATQSYVPLAAKRFLAARGYNGESANDPAVCDLAQLIGVPADVQQFAPLEVWLEKALRDGHWLILAAHDVSDEGGQALSLRVLEEVCRFARHHPELWVDTVANIATHIQSQRN